MTYWQALALAADQGQLYLDSDAARRSSLACDSFIERLQRHRQQALKLANVDGWGEFESGKDLRTMFREKAAGGQNSMVDALDSHIRVVEEMKVVFNKFFAATEAVDTTNADGVRAQAPR